MECKYTTEPMEIGDGVRNEFKGRERKKRMRALLVDGHTYTLLALLGLQIRLALILVPVLLTDPMLLSQQLEYRYSSRYSSKYEHSACTCTCTLIDYISYLYNISFHLIIWKLKRLPSFLHSFFLLLALDRTTLIDLPPLEAGAKAAAAPIRDAKTASFIVRK